MLWCGGVQACKEKEAWSPEQEIFRLWLTADHISAPPCLPPPLLQAIDSLVRVQAELVDYSVNSVTGEAPGALLTAVLGAPCCCGAGGAVCVGGVNGVNVCMGCS